MAKKNVAVRNKINFILFIFFTLSSIIYFTFKNSHEWVRNVFPDAMALVFLSFLLNVMIHRNTKVNVYIIVFGSLFVIFSVLFAIGTINNYIFITDISQEFIAISLITVIIAVIMRKKVAV